MAKKATPIITHTEIISRAIISIEAEINEWRGRCKGLPIDLADIYFENTTKELIEKMDALKIMYRIETGSDFV